MNHRDYIQELNNIHLPITKEDPRTELCNMLHIFNSQDNALLKELQTQASSSSYLLSNRNLINKSLKTRYTMRGILDHDIYQQFLTKLTPTTNITQDDINAMSVLGKIKHVHQAQQKLVNNFYEQRYQNAKYLWRGTATEELDTMLQGQAVWAQNISDSRRYTYLTINPAMAMRYAEINKLEKSKGVVIKFDKESVRNYVRSQGYALKWDYIVNADINNPAPIGAIKNEEHRLKSTAVFNKGINQIIILDVSNEDQLCYNQKYKDLGTIGFEMK